MHYARSSEKSMTDHGTAPADRDSVQFMPILVVDDCKSFLQRMCKILPWRTETALSLDEGLERTRELLPSVILLDVRFKDTPMRNGIDAIRDFKLISPETQVVVATGLYDRIDQRRAINAGALSYVEKSREDVLRALVYAALKYSEPGSLLSGLPQ